MHEKPLTLSRSGTALLLVCVSLLAAAGLYAWLVCETFSAGVLPSPAGSGDVLVNGLRDFPLIFLMSLAGGFACGALVSITLRHQGFMANRSYP
ncbi:hypothetical protein BSU01_23760 [Erwinia billingiae]|uniref:hypothetical protein n=1 Tax=Erwinia billingiae TaxID=182337 RepID=UPI0019CF5E03|nr:hypothetical protein [Erwinia billingiae]MBN7124690.1 hypothetical protein [Erwinia billingiae]